MAGGARPAELPAVPVEQPAVPVGHASAASTARASAEAGDQREVLLEVDGISAGYGETPVLRDVSFVVRRGAIVALLGPNGCGKTTLLRIIGKLHVPTAGVVRVTGRDVAAMSQLDLSRVLATVSQVHQTSFPFSVLDIMLTGRMPYISVLSSPKAADVAFCREVLDLFGISHLEAKAITKLSGGERQLVMIARAIAQQPRVLLLDEPTTYLDLRNQVRVLDTVARLARSQDLTVLMTIHDPNQALAYADRGVLLRKLGALVGADDDGDGGLPETNTIAAGAPAEVLTPANVMRAYGVGVDLIEHANRHLLVPSG